MPALNSFEYAIVRVVPRVEREEFINVGVILFCKAQRFLAARIKLDEQRLATLAPDCDLVKIRERLALIPRICAGGAAAGPIGDLPQAERFRWLTAPRSTVVQVSPVHSGLCDEARAALDEMFEEMVS